VGGRHGFLLTIIYLYYFFSFPTMGKDCDFHRVRPACFGALLVVAAVAFALGYFAHGGSCSPQKYAAEHVHSGAPAHTTTTPDAEINRCVEICSVLRSAGRDLSEGLCLDARLNGYSCAVVVNDAGHCPPYYSGTPEIVLSPECSFVDVFRYSGEQSVSEGTE